MQRECNVRKTRETDTLQEDKNERRNLGRLIHTVQHFPSARYRLSADTLWRLVNELESFQPPGSKESVNSPQKPARKSFSRKYLNLRLYPATDRSSSPESILKSQREEKKSESATDSKANKNKKTDPQKDDTEAVKFESLFSKKCQKRRYLSKTNLDRGKGRKESTSDKNERNIKYPKSNSIPRVSKTTKPQAKLSTFQTKSKSDEKSIPNKINSYDQSYGDHVDRCLDQEKSSVLGSNRKQCKVISKIKGFKHVDSNKPKSRSPSSVGRDTFKAASKDNVLAKDQASMVKKLTNYWNNLLNSEGEESNSISGSSRVPHINKSLQDLARRIYHTVESRQSGTKLLSRHKSESSVDTLRRLDSCHSVTDFHEHFDEIKELYDESLINIKLQRHSLNLKYEPLEYPKEYLFNGVQRASTNSSLTECDFKNGYASNKRSLQVIDENEPQVESSESNFDLKSQNVIEVMEKLIGKLKRFKELPLTSSKITLSHSLRTMLCLMTATVLSSKEDIFGDCYESEVVEEESDNAREASKTALIGAPTVTIRNPLTLRELSTLACRGVQFAETGNCVIYEQSSETFTNNQLVPVQGITMRKVEDAIRYVNLCKDYLWSEFILNPTYNVGSSYYENTSPRSFTIVFEEEIVVDGSCEEDEESCADEMEHEEDDSSRVGSCRSALDCVLVSVEELIDLFTDLILLYWPNSIQDFIKALYQVLVSVLVWWVITKEIFSK